MRFRIPLSLLPHITLICTLICVGCAEPSSAPTLSETAVSNDHLVPVSLNVLPPGIHPQTLSRADGTLLRYTLSVPGGYLHAKGAPLILALHFGGPRRGRAVPPYYGRGVLEILVEPALRDLNAIIIAPDSVGGGWGNENNEQAVLQIMDHVIAKYNIDQDRVLVTGFSMGGRGTWYMAGHHPERFSAAIPIAARPSDEEIEWKVPAYVIHSRDDGLIPLDETEAHVARLQSQGADVQLVVIEGVTHYQTELFAKPLQEAVPWVRKAWEKP